MQYFLLFKANLIGKLILKVPVHRDEICQFPVGFITAIVVNPPERKVAKSSSVQSTDCQLIVLADYQLNFSMLSTVMYY